MSSLVRLRAHVAGALARGLASGQDEAGFGLVESLISVGLAATGLMAVAGLMAAGAGLQMRSRDTGRAAMAAVQQMERLRILPAVDARVQLGGSLTGPLQNNYSAQVNVPPAGIVRLRWLVQQGPANSLQITVRAEPDIEKARTSDVVGLVWRPQ
jgi:hypothetical protein